MAWIVMALLIQAILANPTPPKEVVEEEVLPKESPDESQSINRVLCSSGFEMSTNGKCVKMDSIKVVVEEDLCELFGIACEEESTQRTLGPAEEIFEETTTFKNDDEEEALTKKSPDKSQSMFDGVCCSSGYAYARSANGKWVKLEAIKVLEETFDICVDRTAPFSEFRGGRSNLDCEFFEIDYEEENTQITLEPAEEITDYPDYPNYEQSISGIRCTGGLTMSPNGGCVETVTIEVDYEIDLCGIFGLC